MSKEKKENSGRTFVNAITHKAPIAQSESSPANASLLNKLSPLTTKEDRSYNLFSRYEKIKKELLTLDSNDREQFETIKRVIKFFKKTNTTFNHHEALRISLNQNNNKLVDLVEDIELASEQTEPLHNLLIQCLYLHAACLFFISFFEKKIHNAPSVLNLAIQCGFQDANKTYNFMRNFNKARRELHKINIAFKRRKVHDENDRSLKDKRKDDDNLLKTVLLRNFEVNFNGSLLRKFFEGYSNAVAILTHALNLNLNSSTDVPDATHTSINRLG